LEDGRITDSQLIASSYYSQDYRARCGRLNRVDSSCPGAWVPGSLNAEGEYLQVDLLKVHIITKVAIQGRGAVADRWTKKYYLSYKQDKVGWQNYTYTRGDFRVGTTLVYTVAVPGFSFMKGE